MCGCLQRYLNDAIPPATQAPGFAMHTRSGPEVDPAALAPRDDRSAMQRESPGGAVSARAETDRRLCTICSLAGGIVWLRADRPVLARSASAMVAGLASRCSPGPGARIRYGHGTRPWVQAGGSLLRCGKVRGPGAWCSF